MSQYECANCNFTADERAFPIARDLLSRLIPGETYTDRECPRANCGALAYPVKEEVRILRAEPMTDVEYLAQRGNHCPFCDSDQIEGSEINIDDNSAWQEIGCTDCGREWNDLYQLIGYKEI